MPRRKAADQHLEQPGMRRTVSGADAVTGGYPWLVAPGRGPFRAHTAPVRARPFPAPTIS